MQRLTLQPSERVAAVPIEVVNGLAFELRKRIACSLSRSSFRRSGIALEKCCPDFGKDRG